MADDNLLPPLPSEGSAPVSEPPPAVDPPISRSEMLQRRKAERQNILQSTYDAWESANPVWAQRLTGSAAAEALGYNNALDPVHASRHDLLHDRKLAMREAAVRSSGFDEHNAGAAVLSAAGNDADQCITTRRDRAVARVRFRTSHYESSGAHLDAPGRHDA